MLRLRFRFFEFPGEEHVLNNGRNMFLDVGLKLQQTSYID